MLMMSATEFAMHNLFSVLTGVTDKAAKVIFPKLPIGAVIDYLPKLIELSDMPDEVKDRLDDICDQYDDINEMRNDFAHQVNYWDDETASKVLSLDKKKMHHDEALAKANKYDIPSLVAATADLDNIQDQVEIIAVNLRAQRNWKLPFEDIRAHDTFHYTWQYTHPSKPSRPKHVPRSAKRPHIPGQSRPQP